MTGWIWSFWLVFAAWLLMGVIAFFERRANNRLRQENARTGRVLSAMVMRTGISSTTILRSELSGVSGTTLEIGETRGFDGGIEKVTLNLVRDGPVAEA